MFYKKKTFTKKKQKKYYNKITFCNVKNCKEIAKKGKII